MTSLFYVGTLLTAMTMNFTFVTSMAFRISMVELLSVFKWTRINLNWVIIFIAVMSLKMRSWFLQAIKDFTTNANAYYELSGLMAMIIVYH